MSYPHLLHTTVAFIAGVLALLGLDALLEVLIGWLDGMLLDCSAAFHTSHHSRCR